MLHDFHWQQLFVKKWKIQVWTTEQDLDELDYVNQLLHDTSSAVLKKTMVL